MCHGPISASIQRKEKTSATAATTGATQKYLYNGLLSSLAV
jgi:hypothetical protein